MSGRSPSAAAPKRRQARRRAHNVYEAACYFGEALLVADHARR
jgi:hypothetical protein